MRIIKKWLLIICLVSGSQVFGQNRAPAGGNATAASRTEATSVNNYTGIPSISVPFYSYSHHNGLNFELGLNYYGGGIKLFEEPSVVGMGWNLNMGGVITRTVKGVPDDYSPDGFMYSPAIKTNTHFNLFNYDLGRLDGEQDIFQFSFNGRSGKFLIGKDSSILQIPSSKMQIFLQKRITLPDEDFVEYDTISAGVTIPMGVAKITSIILKDENGIKYFFDDLEYQKMDKLSMYEDITYRLKYVSAWYLTKILSPSGVDSIKINYGIGNNINQPEIPIQVVRYYNNSLVNPDTLGTNGNLDAFVPAKSRFPLEVILPNRTKIEFNYTRSSSVGINGNSSAKLLNTNERILRRIQISDSATRYGYMLNWDTSGIGIDSRGYLTGIDFFDKIHAKKLYTFGYNGPFFRGETYDGNPDPNFSNRQDYWGFYNGANNSKDYVPTVPGIYNGANREPNNLAIASSLAYIKKDDGGITYYDFENNDIYPITQTSQFVVLDPIYYNSQVINISKALGANTYFKVHFDTTYVKNGEFPIIGNGNAKVELTDMSGAIIYSSDTLSLRDLYFTGITSFNVKLPSSGAYRIFCYLLAGTSSSTGLPLRFKWFNQTLKTNSGDITGGIRIKRVRHYDAFTNKTDTLSTYRYVTESGKSSGFIGRKIDYQIWNCLSDGSWPNNQINYRIGSNPVNHFDYSLGSSVGYSRVEVIKGTLDRNLGKEVFEYSNINDEGYDNSPMVFPQTAEARREWTWGLPKKIFTYDKVGKLIKSTQNIFDFPAISKKNDSNYTALKVFKTCNNPTLFTPYIAQKYSPIGGRANLISTIDTFFHTNNSITTSRKDLTYDNNFNITKTSTPYDLNKNLVLENRTYYPYNYTVGGEIGILRDSSIMIPVSTESWIVGDGNPRLLKSSITNFVNYIPYKRSFLITGLTMKPFLKYSLETNKPLSESTIGIFNPALLIRDTNYIRPQQKLSYARNGLVLEIMNAVTLKSNSIIYGHNNSKIIAEVTNSSYSDVAYTSFEPSSQGGWDYNLQTVDTTLGITGGASYNLGGGQVIKDSLNTAQHFIVSFWATGIVNVNGVYSGTPLEMRNNWSFYTQNISNVSTIILGGNGLIDELRLYPEHGNMTTTSYLPTGEISSIADANNNIAYNEYDGIRRIKVIRDKNKNIINKYEYSDSIFTPNFEAVWININTGINLMCEIDSNLQRTGNVLQPQYDINPYSLTMGAIRYVFSHVDHNYCPLIPPTCPSGVKWRIVNNICQEGVKHVTSSVYKQVVRPDGTTGYMWVCTYHYRWSDGVISSNYTEQSQSSCNVPPSDEP